MNATFLRTASSHNPAAVSQGFRFCLQVLLAILVWGAMMLVITLAKPDYIPPATTWLLSFLMPILGGVVTQKIHPDRISRHVWLAGMIWFLIVGLWVLDMPTSLHHCLHCNASEKLYLTFISLNRDSNLLDGQGRFLGTWSATALIGYAIGSRFGLKLSQHS